MAKKTSRSSSPKHDPEKARSARMERRMMAFVDLYCREHPLEQATYGAVALVEALQAKAP